MPEKHVTRYEKYPDSASYHRSPSWTDTLRTLYFKFRYHIEIGPHSKICPNVDIRVTRGGDKNRASYHNCELHLYTLDPTFTQSLYRKSYRDWEELYNRF